MNILICNERFSFRFGVDRVLIMLGNGLRNRGHKISIMSNRYDQEIVESFASKIIKVPTDTKEPLNLNEYTSEWLQNTWDQHFNNETKPDIVIIAGWPFFSAIPFFRKVSQKVIFIDGGAVPLEDHVGYALIIQNKLRKLRKQYLQQTSIIISISEFISNSQSKLDANNKALVHTILLGTDHMEMKIWSSEKHKLGDRSGYAINLLNSLKNEGRQTILCLGRWNPKTNKNVEAAFDIMPQINKVYPKSALLILANPSDTKLPSNFKNIIFPIGFPDDQELLEIMEGTDLGLTFSLWEGFNLPLTEMQWVNQSVLAFNVGAHPEVILHPWYLCKDNTEMAEKACDILAGRGLDADNRKKALLKFHNDFKWERFIQDFEMILFNQVTCFIIDVTNSTKDPANPGIIRVSRRLSRELQNHTNPIFVVWDHLKQNYFLPNKTEWAQLSQFNGPTPSNQKRITLDKYLISSDKKKNTWIIFPENPSEDSFRERRNYSRKMGFNTAVIFHDSIPILRPDLCNEMIRNQHDSYMRGLTECDVVIPNSNFSAECLIDFWKEKDITGSNVLTDLLPGEAGGSKRNQTVQKYPTNEINILCVSNLEPRKNHIKLIKACLLMQENHPDLDWKLTLVGNRYADVPEIPDYIESISKKNPRIKWLGIVSDDTLHQLYEKATFTIYASIIEGFGLPIMESLWHGRPCICYQEGVMTELAADGGCLTTDVTDEQLFSEAIYRLASDKELLVKLSKEAVARKIKTWEDYVIDFLAIMRTQTKDDNPNWQDILYQNCILENWQMNDSERLALTALLVRHKPKCCIEIGTFKGGSLSLISQYSEMIYSIDIDPSIPDKLGDFENVSFLTGPSTVVLPLLLKELDEQDIPVDFILIDGDHSAEGIRQDINIILSYIPKKPLFVMMHDSFNPECRRGMLEAEWEKSPYVDWVDIDYIPGRMIEHGGGGDGEMWGGLGLAYLTPLVRKNRLNINKSANRMYEIVKSSTGLPLSSSETINRLPKQKNKKILLIEPPFYRLYKNRYSLHKFPLALGYLSSVIKKETEWDVMAYNSDFMPNPEPFENTYVAGPGFDNYLDNLKSESAPIWKEVKSVIEEYKPDVVGITSKTQNFVSAQRVAKIVKEINNKTIVIVGGPHPSMAGIKIFNCPDIDIGARGEGENTIVELLNAIENKEDLDGIKGIFYKKNGHMIENPPRELIQDLDSLPFPHEIAPQVLKNYDTYPKDAFQFIFAIRGCPYNCVFCGSREIWSRKVRYRSPESVVNEIKKLQEKGLNQVYFDDDTFGVNKKYIHSLCHAILNHCPSITWRCEIHAKLVDEETISLMKKAGCVGIQIGVESGNNEILELNRKKITIEEALSACKIIKKYNIYLMAFFIVGFPQETEETLQDTVSAMEKIECDHLIYSIFTPYPGTEAFYLCKEKGLLDENYDIALYNHQSPANCFTYNIPPERFRKLASNIEKMVDEKNKLNFKLSDVTKIIPALAKKELIKKVFSLNTLKAVRNLGIKKSFQEFVKLIKN